MRTVHGEEFTAWAWSAEECRELERLVGRMRPEDIGLKRYTSAGDATMAVLNGRVVKAFCEMVVDAWKQEGWGVWPFVGMIVSSPGAGMVRVGDGVMAVGAKVDSFLLDERRHRGLVDMTGSLFIDRISMAPWGSVSSYDGYIHLNIENIRQDMEKMCSGMVGEVVWQGVMEWVMQVKNGRYKVNWDTGMVKLLSNRISVVSPAGDLEWVRGTLGEFTEWFQRRRSDRGPEVAEQGRKVMGLARLVKELGQSLYTEMVHAGRPYGARIGEVMELGTALSKRGKVREDWFEYAD